MWGKKMGEGCLIEPLVIGVELGEHNDQNFHAADSTMAGSGPNHDARARFHGNQLIIQFDRRLLFTFQYIVGLRQPSVIVSSGVDRDIRDVDGARKVVHFRQCAASFSAGARNSWYVVEVDDFVTGSWHDSCGRLDSWQVESRRGINGRCVSAGAGPQWCCEAVGGGAVAGSVLLLRVWDRRAANKEFRRIAVEFQV